MNGKFNKLKYFSSSHVKQMNNWEKITSIWIISSIVLFTITPSFANRSIFSHIKHVAHSFMYTPFKNRHFVLLIRWNGLKKKGNEKIGACWENICGEKFKSGFNELCNVMTNELIFHQLFLSLCTEWKWKIA